MNIIAVATDFSERSERAVQRATLLAKQYGAEMVIFHVVDNDQPARFVQSQQVLAQEMIDSISAKVTSSDGVPCRASICLGPVADTVVRTVKEVEADLLVIGPSRPQRIGHLLTGTVCERVIRACSCPVLMSKGIPSTPYTNILVATDLSAGAEAALAAAGKLGMFTNTLTGVVYAFFAHAYKLMMRTSSSKKDIEEYMQSERSTAQRDLQEWLEKVSFSPDYSVVEFIDITPAQLIQDCVRVHGADLVVVGISGKSGLSRFLLGSVAEGVLRDSKVDVLTG